MEKLRILFVNQEIEPYVVGTPMASLGLRLPQHAQELGYEIRTFMPKFGVINERRNQLHEVIRLSGLNLVIAGNDHPLMIKVASMQALRLQVYFIDNEDFFLRRGITRDPLGTPYDDNDQRAFFFAKGVLETVKKLRWIPDIIHCNGWFTAFVPPMVRLLYANEPTFNRAKILFTIYDDDPEELLGNSLESIIKALKIKDLAGIDPNDQSHASLCRFALQYSDMLGFGDYSYPKELVEYAKQRGLPVVDLRTSDNQEDIYQQLAAIVPDYKEEA